MSALTLISKWWPLVRYAEVVEWYLSKSVLLEFQRTNGVCLSCRSIDRIRDTSLLLRCPLGLNSHNRQILSHSWPGTFSSLSFVNASSASLYKLYPNTSSHCQKCTLNLLINSVVLQNVNSKGYRSDLV